MSRLYRTKPLEAQSTSPEPLSIEGIRVRPTSKSLVVPTVPTEEHWLSLSNLDRVVNPTFSSVILFYKNVVSSENKNAFRDVTRSLKDSLAKTLVHFYPLAGRLALGEDGLVDLHCNDEGALFFEAMVESDLATLGGPKPMPALSGMDLARLGPGPTYIPDQLQTMPPLVIMVTKFACGSIAIAVNWHHTVADGSSGCHFVKSWTEMAMGNELSVVPNHDRLLLKPRNPPNAAMVSGYSTNSVEKVFEYSSSSTCLPTTPPTLNSFYINKSAVLELKAKACSEDEENRQYTSAESISAHLWRQMTKARVDEKDQGGPRDSSTRFFMFVDGRKKMGLPSGYFGNVVCSACAVAGEDDILNKPVSYAASLIRAATRSISGDYFRSLIDWVDIQGTKPSKSEHINSLGHDVAATFWTFFPLYEMDFGWGKPALAARNSGARPLIDGIAMMPSSDGPGNMVALVNLHADRMERITRQKSFKAYFSNN